MFEKQRTQPQEQGRGMSAGEAVQAEDEAGLLYDDQTLPCFGRTCFDPEA